MPITANAINPFTTVSVPLVRGSGAESVAFNFTLGPAGVVTIPIEAEAFPVAFTITGTDSTTPANQCCSGAVHLSSATATPLLHNLNGLVASGATAGQVNVTRSGSSIVLTAGPTNTIRLRLTRIN